MWFQTLLMLLAASSAMSDIEVGITQCIDAAGEKPFANVKNIKWREKHGVLCSLFHDFITCLQGVAQKELGTSLEEIIIMLTMEDTGDARQIELVVNTLDVIEEVCTEGTELNADVMADIDCLDTLGDRSIRCADEAHAAYEAFSGFVGNAEEEIDDEEFHSDRLCMLNAYDSACLAVTIHDACGKRAFDTFNTIIKRTSIFKNAFCSQQALEKLKTTFLESLEMGEEERKLFSLAFDLKKRRK